MIARAFKLAFQQLPDPAFRRIALLGAGLSLALFVALALGVYFGLETIPKFESAWLDGLVQAAGWLVYLGLLWLLFPAVASAFVGLFLDDVAAAVEARHYPGDPAGVAPSLSESMALSLKPMLALTLVNLLVLPLYLIAIFVPPLGLAMFWGVNGYLLGREYFEIAAARHLPAVEARRLRRQRRGAVFVAGMGIAALFTVPGLNLVAPVIGAAAMVHVLKAAMGRRSVLR